MFEQRVGALKVMFALQNSLNSVIDPNWFTAGHNWQRAIWTEAAELVNHQGWAWWKKQVPDTKQVQLEVIDIWHFLLSLLLVQYNGKIPDAVIAGIVGMYDSVQESIPANLVPDVNVCAEVVASMTLDSMDSTSDTDKLAVVSAFFMLCTATNITFTDLFNLYVGKNILNEFRKGHGYKEGTYIKTWFEREDNEYLSEIMESYEYIDPENFTKIKDCIMEKLKVLYGQVLVTTLK